MGLLQRHSEKGKSKVRTFPVDGVKQRAMKDRVLKNVEDGSALYTDAFKSYFGLDVYYQHNVDDGLESIVRLPSHQRRQTVFLNLTYGLPLYTQRVPRRR